MVIMYKISKYSGKIQVGNMIFLQDKNEALYHEYLQWLQNDGTPEIVDYFDDEFKEIQLLKIFTLQKIVLDKIKRYSLALAMGKSINDDLEYFEKAYTTKYEMCKGIKVDPYNSILIESQLEGFSTKQEYVEIVILKFEQGLMFRDIALQMSEVLRKLMFNDISILDYSKAMARLEIVNQLNSNITAGEVSGVFQQVLNL